jgi:hypothetical protein
MDLEELITYEHGDLREQEEAKFLQKIINNGSVWKLQGTYGRHAMAAIEQGLCLLGNKGFKDYYGNYVPSRSEVKDGTKGTISYSALRQGQA